MLFCLISTGAIAQQACFRLGLASHIQTTNKIVKSTVQLGPTSTVGVQWKYVGGYLLFNYNQYLGLPESVEKAWRIESKFGISLRREEESKWNLHLQLGINQSLFYLPSIETTHTQLLDRRMYWSHKSGGLGFSYSPYPFAELFLGYTWERPGKYFYTACSYLSVGVVLKKLEK